MDPRGPVRAEPPPGPRWRDWQTWRGWLSLPWVQGLLALALYLTVWLSTAVSTLVSHPGKAQLDQISMDPNFYVWCLRWWPFAIGHGINPLYTHYVGAPFGHSLAWVTTIPPIALLATPLTLAAGPIAAFNLLTAIALPVSAWAAFLMCRRLTGRFWAALVGGAVFGFSAYEMNHSAAGQLNLTFSLLLPILGYLIVRWRDDSIKPRTFVILMAITLAVQFYLFLETFADLTAILVVSFAVGFLLAGRAAWPRLLRLGKLIGLAYVFGLALAAPYLGYAFMEPPPKLLAVTGLDSASLVIPRPERTFGIAWLTHAARGPIEVSSAGYVGIPLLLLVILLAITGWSSKLVRYLTVMLTFIIVAALGPGLYWEGKLVLTLPWARLWQLPFLRNAYPSRLMLFAFLGLAVATALFLAGPAKRLWARWPLGLLVILAIALDTPPLGINPNTSVPKFISSGEYQHHLAKGEIVVVISQVGNAGMLWQADSDFYWRLAGGYINQAITRRTDLPAPVQELAHATPLSVLNFEAYVKNAKIGAILLDNYREPLWVGVFRRIGLKGVQYGNVWVYQTDGCRTCRVLDRSQLKL